MSVFTSMMFNNKPLVEYRMFVTTPRGMEFITSQEIRERFNSTGHIENIRSLREFYNKGIVSFTLVTRTDDVLATLLTECVELRSIDNIFATIALKDSNFPLEEEEGYEQAEAMGTNPPYLQDAMHVLKVAQAHIAPKDPRVLPAKKEGLPPINLDEPLFRVTCVRDGMHKFRSQDVAGRIGYGIEMHTGWKVCLTKWDLEIYARCCDDGMWIGLSLTHRDHTDLYKRHRTVLCPTTLKASIAYGMCKLANIVPGEDVILCDPMCGSGTIPIEAALAWPGVSPLVFAGDNNTEAVDITAANIKGAGGLAVANVQGIAWNAAALPLRDGCVDVFFSDMPYGQRCGCRRDNIRNYGKILKEIARILVPHGKGRAVLLTYERALMKKLLTQLADIIVCKKFYLVDNSGYQVGLYLLTTPE